MKRSVVIASSYSNASRLAPMVLKGAVWFYAGRNMERYAEFKRTLGANLSHQSLNEHPDFVSKQRKLFIQWTDEVHRQHGNHLEHWLSDRFSSYPYVSDLYLHCLSIAWFQHLLRAFPDRDIILIAESNAVLSAAHQVTKSLGIDATTRRVGTLKAKLYFLLQVVSNLHQLGALPYYLLRFAVARSMPARINTKELKNISAILDTYLFDHSFNQAGHFHNRYFTELHDLLVLNHTPTALLPILHRINIRTFPSLIRHMRHSEHMFLLMEDYVLVSDYFRAFKEALSCGSKEKQVPLFSGTDVQPLVDELNALKMFSASCFFAHVIHKLPKRLRDKGISPEIYLQWNENSTFNKALNHGFHRDLPNAVIVGGKPFVPPLNHLNLFCTSAERSFGFSPDRIVTCGSALLAAYAQHDPNGTYHLGASFRYDYLWKLYDQPFQAHTTTAITILLPYDLGISQLLLALSSRTLKGLMEKGRQIVIKGHPANKPEDLADMLSRTGLNHRSVRISQDTMSQILLNTAAVVSSSSSSSIEAMCFGIPAVLIGLPVGLDLNMHDLLPSALWKMAFSEDDVYRHLTEWALQHPLPLEIRREIGRAILGSFFEPVTERAMTAYLAPRAAAA